MDLKIGLKAHNTMGKIRINLQFRLLKRASRRLNLRDISKIKIKKKLYVSKRLKFALRPKTA
jgi:hypothetical protein